MKTFGLAGLFAIVFLLTGCFWFMDIPPMNLTLMLSFQDASGNDLVEGIGYKAEPNYDYAGDVERELYTLLCSADKPTARYRPSISLSYRKDPVGETRYSNLVFLAGEERNSRITFTFLLTCPYVFGDEAEHEITAYCRKKKGDYECFRLTFDGKEIVPAEKDGDNANCYAKATIIVDRE
jgi:hypothetical protein